MHPGLSEEDSYWWFREHFSPAVRYSLGRALVDLLPVSGPARTRCDTEKYLTRRYNRLTGIQGETREKIFRGLLTVWRSGIPVLTGDDADAARDKQGGEYLTWIFADRKKLQDGEYSKKIGRMLQLGTHAPCDIISVVNNMHKLDVGLFNGAPQRAAEAAENAFVGEIVIAATRSDIHPEGTLLPYRAYGATRWADGGTLNAPSVEQFLCETVNASPAAHRELRKHRARPDFQDPGMREAVFRGTVYAYSKGERQADGRAWLTGDTECLREIEEPRVWVAVMSNQTPAVPMHRVTREIRVLATGVVIYALEPLDYRLENRDVQNPIENFVNGHLGTPPTEEEIDRGRRWKHTDETNTSKPYSGHREYGRIEYLTGPDVRSRQITESPRVHLIEGQEWKFGLISAEYCFEDAEGSSVDFIKIATPCQRRHADIADAMKYFCDIGSYKEITWYGGGSTNVYPQGTLSHKCDIVQRMLKEHARLGNPRWCERPGDDIDDDISSDEEGRRERGDDPSEKYRTRDGRNNQGTGRRRDSNTEGSGRKDAGQNQGETRHACRPWPPEAQIEARGCRDSRERHDSKSEKGQGPDRPTSPRQGKERRTGGTDPRVATTVWEPGGIVGRAAKERGPTSLELAEAGGESRQLFATNQITTWLEDKHLQAKQLQPYYKGPLSATTWDFTGDSRAATRPWSPGRPLRPRPLGPGRFLCSSMT